MWDSLRDVIGPALKMMGYSMNTGDDGQLNQAKERLIAQRSLVKGYLGDEIRDIMIADEGALAIIYSGEAKTAIDQNPNLSYVIPKEGSNKWVDGFVIVKGTQQLEAAHQFIDFMCSPNIAIRNMTTTGYTSPIFAVWGEFCENPVMFPTEEELARCEAFRYDPAATAKYAKLWGEIR
jgi:spermidine/putrescine-binding protein